MAQKNSKHFSGTIRSAESALGAPENEPAPEAAALRHGDNGPANGALAGVYYFTQWLNLSVLAVFINLPGGAGANSWLHVAGWVLSLGIVGLFAAGTRNLIHDTLIALQPREKIGLTFLVGCLFYAPAIVPRAHVMPDGFMWAAPLLAILAVDPAASRRLLAWTLLGAWFAAYNAPGLHGVVLATLFGISWLAALGASHFAFTGEAYGLGGGWAAQRLVRAVAAISIPAALAGGATLWLWNFSGAGARHLGPRQPKGAPIDPLAAQHRLIDMLDSYTVLELIWRGGVALVVVIIGFAILLYLRRRWLRLRATGVPEMLPGQTAQLEYEALEPPAPEPHLSGTRGQIAALWGRWSAALDKLGVATPPRTLGETASQFASRVSLAETAPPFHVSSRSLLQSDDKSPVSAITRLLENAHYGPAEPTRGEVAQMRALVADELSRLSLERQIPVDPLPSEEDNGK